MNSIDDSIKMYVIFLFFNLLPSSPNASISPSHFHLSSFQKLLFFFVGFYLLFLYLLPISFFSPPSSYLTTIVCSLFITLTVNQKFRISNEQHSQGSERSYTSCQANQGRFALYKLALLVWYSLNVDKVPWSRFFVFQEARSNCRDLFFE